MTPEVKKRIEQIRQGIVPEGYKKGKIGIVPIKWNEVPFSTLFTSTSEYTDDLKQYPLYSLTIEDGITAKTERYERSHLVKKENSYKVVRPNDYAYNPMNIRFGAVARHKGDIPVAVSGYYDIFTTVHESDLVFMDSFLTYGPMITYYNKVSTGSLVEKQRVHFSDFLEFSLALPPLEERKKIAEILSTQDKAIELQGRKIEELKRFKKGCLEKMFPRKGQKVPEKRFPGFTDDWEQRKLGEVSKRVIVGLATSVTPYYREKGAPILRNLNIKENYLDDTDILFLDRTYAESQISKQIHAGDVLTVHTGYIGTSCVVPEKYDKCLTFTTLITTTDESVLKGAFLAQYLNSEIGMSAVQAVTTQGGRQNLNTNDFVKVEIRYPSLAEQNKICTVLSSIDNLITLHQRKLEEMKKQKKALMQLLLTGIVRVRL